MFTMRIHLAAVVISVAATAAAVIGAVALGATFLTLFIARVGQSPSPATIGMWVAIAGGLAAALIPMLSRRNGRQDTSVRHDRDR
jgi:hypothetical protein